MPPLFARDPEVVELARQQERSHAVDGEQAALGRDAAWSGDGGLLMVCARPRFVADVSLHLQQLNAQDRSVLSDPNIAATLSVESAESEPMAIDTWLFDM